MGILSKILRWFGFGKKQETFAEPKHLKRAIKSLKAINRVEIRALAKLRKKNVTQKNRKRSRKVTYLGYGSFNPRRGEKLAWYDVPDDFGRTHRQKIPVSLVAYYNARKERLRRMRISASLKVHHERTRR